MGILMFQSTLPVRKATGQYRGMGVLSFPHSQWSPRRTTAGQRGPKSGAGAQNRLSAQHRKSIVPLFEGKRGIRTCKRGTRTSKRGFRTGERGMIFGPKASGTWDGPSIGRIHSDGSYSYQPTLQFLMQELLNTINIITGCVG